MARAKKKVDLPDPLVTQPDRTVTKGSHLTVTTFQNGRTELEWDWDALVRDVNEAIALVKVVEITEEAVKKTRGRKKKVAE